MIDIRVTQSNEGIIKITSNSQDITPNDSYLLAAVVAVCQAEKAAQDDAISWGIERHASHIKRANECPICHLYVADVELHMDVDHTADVAEEDDEDPTDGTRPQEVSP